MPKNTKTTSSKGKKIKAIIFDMDGVLVDAKRWHYEALNKSLKYYGFSPISNDDHISKYDGLPTKEKLKLHPETKDLDEEWHKKINQKKQEMTTYIIDKKCIPYKPHQDGLKRLKKDGYKLAVCSNAIRASVDCMLCKSKLSKYLDFFLSNQDVVNPKPHPEIYKKAIEKLKVKPDEVLICEDNIKGITAAKRSQGYVLEIGTISDVTYDNIKNTIKKIEEGKIKQITKPPIRTVQLSEMLGGWFIGNFFPNIFKTQSFEIAIKSYKKGSFEKWHVHDYGTEITAIIGGRAKMASRVLKDGDIILLEPGQGTSFSALTNLKTIVIKVPSVQNDKRYEPMRVED